MSHLKGPDISTRSRFRPSTSVLQLLAEGLHKNGDAVALVEGQTGNSASFKDILVQSTSIAAGLHRAGVNASDFVVLCCEKSILAYSLLLGTMFTGATAVLVPTQYTDIVDKLTKNHSVKAVFCNSEYMDSMKKSVANMNPVPAVMASTDTEDPTLASITSCTDEFSIFQVKDIYRHVPLILFSSGTTGEPKGIEITDVAVQLSGINFDYPFKSFLVTSPFYWYSGLFTFTSAVYNRYPLIMSNIREVKENLRLTEKYQIEGWFVSTGMMTQYTNEPTLRHFDLSCVKKVYVAGENTLGCVAKSFVSTVLGDRVKLEIVYGITECGLLTLFGVEDHEFGVKLGSCGKLNPGVELKVLNEDGSLASVGALGIVWIKSLAATTGYWGRPDLTGQLFGKDGFFNSNDVGYVDDDGYIYLRGRAADLINYKGEKFSPIEVESILMSHPAVLDAVVVGRSHPKDNQHATAVVVRKPGSTVSEDEIAAFINGKVEDKQKLRGGARFVESLPRITVGKVDRKALRAAAC